jgi:4,4'-diaponeurosporenoate glycosyltransferase
VIWIAVSMAWAGSLLAGAAAWWLFGNLRPLPRGAGRPGAKVSVVVPARNEADGIGALLDTLAAQTMPVHEVIVVDDQSEDDTARLAAERGARVVSGKVLPDGWLGKPWACHQGAQLATGDLLMFVDADVRLGDDAVDRLVTASEDGEVVVSVCPWHAIERAYEELSVFFNLLMVGGIGASGPRGQDAGGIGLFGQVMMISRRHHAAVGGHGAVRRVVLENLRMSKMLEEMGIRRRSYVGLGSVTMRMFPGGAGDLVASWLKGFASGAGLTPRWAMTVASLWLSGLMMVIVAVPVGLATAAGERVALAVLGAAYLAACGPLVALFKRVGRFSPWSALCFPVPLLFYQVVFGLAVARARSGVKVKWKGRDVG